MAVGLIGLGLLITLVCSLYVVFNAMSGEFGDLLKHHNRLVIGMVVGWLISILGLVVFIVQTLA